MEAESQVAGLLAGIAAASDAVDALHLAEDLRRVTSLNGSPGDAVALAAAADGDHDFVALGAIHALGAVPGDAAAVRLRKLLGDDRPFVVEHAAWALSARAPVDGAVAGLTDVMVAGGFPAMLAQRTLAGWSTPAVVRAALAALTTSSAHRSMVVELLGELGDGPDVMAALLRIADDAADPVSAIALRTLGGRSVADDVLRRAARHDDHRGRVALLALTDRDHADPFEPTVDGLLAVAQVVLFAPLHASGDQLGRGDNGGLAALVAQLGQALLETGRVAEVSTIAQGTVEQALIDSVVGPYESERRLAVPITHDGVTRAEGWVHRLAVERGIERALRSGRRPDVLHLRMADIGTLAAQRVARRLGIPVVFTAAPDPHVPLRQAHTRGEVSLEDFGSYDQTDHWWFRSRLVERLTATADRVVVLPRPGGATELEALLGPATAPALRAAPVVPEGIDPRPVRRAVDRHLAGSPPAHPLVTAIEELPLDRHGLPLVISVGRLHAAKGMATLVAAWSADGELAATTNLVIIGGDLAAPNADEQGVLDDIATVAGDAAERRSHGIVLLGHQPPAVVADALAAASAGVDDVIGSGGVYVAAAPKEEFGLAIVEALAAGLVVVVPQVGGPATYVDDGVIGVLADTTDPSALAGAIGRARHLVGQAGRVEAAARLVDERLGIGAMAAALLDAYEGVVTSA